MRKTNGIPADEMFLAKLIQNAKARNLRACKGHEFKFAASDRYNPSARQTPHTVEEINQAQAIAVGVCAIGAAKLSWDTRRSLSSYRNIAEGNDATYQTTDPTVCMSDISGFTVGTAFHQALNE